jgi:F-type H+-transporting ATPase subunit epsilon
MTTSNLKINLVTPEKLYLSEEAEIVVAPGVLGDFGAMSGHAPFVSLLRPGIIDITLKNGEKSKLFVASGFVEVNDTTCTILAEEVFPLTDLSADLIQKEIEQIQFDIDHASSDKERDKLLAKREISELKLQSIKLA